MSASNCRLTFNEYVQYLARVLSSCIRWPSILECRQNAPQCFDQFKIVRSIFEQSRIINRFEPHVDSVMVDKGFLIDQICMEHFIKIYRSLFLRKKKHFSSVEAKMNVCKSSSSCRTS